MGKWGKSIVMAAVIVIVISLLVPVVYVIRFLGRSASVRDEIARIKAEGAPVSAADLAGKPIPDAENAAIVYEKAFKLLPKNEPPVLRQFSDPDERAKAIGRQRALPFMA